MTTPREEQPPTPPTTGPTVSTAPPRSRWAWPRVPAHVGPARTSTVILALLFVGIFALYLAVRPDPATVTPTGTTGGSQPTQVQQPSQTATTTPSRTTPPTTPSSTSATPTTGSTSRTASSSSATSTGSSTTASQSTVPLPTTGSAPTS